MLGISYAFWIIWCILWTIGYVHLLYTFNHNLFLLVVSQRRTIVCGDNTGSIELNMKQIRLLSTIRKHTILGFFLICGSLCYAFLAGIHIWVETTQGFNISIFIVRWILFHIFLISGPLSIYLGFKQNKDLYGKCCILCDRKCEHICIKLAEKRLY